jgi:hypothetical protein
LVAAVGRPPTARLLLEPEQLSAVRTSIALSGELLAGLTVEDPRRPRGTVPGPDP